MDDRNASKTDSSPEPTAPKDPVPHAVFSVDDVKVREKYAVWRDSIACIFDVEATKETRENNFYASVDTHMLDSIMLARTHTRGQQFNRTSMTIGRDSMDHIMIQLYETGHTSCEHRNGETDIPQSGLLVFDLSQEVYGKTFDFNNLSMFIPRKMLENSLKDIDGQHMRALSPHEPMVKLLRDHMLSLKTLAGQMTASQAIEIAPATATLTAACLNASAADTPGGIEVLSNTQYSVAKQYIESQLCSRLLTPETIAKAVGVSRSRLYDMFKPFGGIAAYIKERRLNLALRRIINKSEGHIPIHTIAMDCGFASDSDFSRSFKKRFEMTPREARQFGVGSKNELIDRNDLSNLDRRYELWMQSLSG